MGRSTACLEASTPQGSCRPRAPPPAPSPAEHAGQPGGLDGQRASRCPTWWARPQARQCRHPGTGLRRQHDHRHHLPTGPPRQRRQPEPRCQHPGVQRQHGDDLGLPVDRHDDHLTSTRRRRRRRRREHISTTTRVADGRLKARPRRSRPGPSCPGNWRAARAPTRSGSTRGGTAPPRSAASRWRRPMTMPSVGLGRHLEDVGNRVAVARRASGSGWPRTGWAARRRRPARRGRWPRSCRASARGRRTIWAAVGLADALVAQAHAEDGDLPGQLGHHAMLTPPSSGRPGPGEITTASGAAARMPATSMASLRNTTGSAPSSPSSWTRL